MDPPPQVSLAVLDLFVIKRHHIYSVMRQLFTHQYNPNNLVLSYIDRARLFKTNDVVS